MSTVSAAVAPEALSQPVTGLVSKSGVAPQFSNIVVFGDSLSGTGNFARRTEHDFFIRYPGVAFNYDNGRFTDGPGTVPPARAHTGIWHEQLAELFLSLIPAIDSLDGGTDYAFGWATTEDGVSARAMISPLGTQVMMTVDNLGKQVGDYLSQHAPDAAALHIVWGGSNDLIDVPSLANASATAGRVGALVRRLTEAGARHLLVANVPPLGTAPKFSAQMQASADLNAASAKYRMELENVLNDIDSEYDAAGVPLHLYRLDIYGLYQRIAADPAAYGFQDIVNSARGRNVHADGFLFWDDVHPTTACHYQIAAEAYRVLGEGRTENT